MSVTKNWNNTNFSLPDNREPRGTWGVGLSAFLKALADNALSKYGGSFPITGADINFGTNYGLVVQYLKSTSANIAQSGVLRLANNEGIGFRNAANNADLILKANASNQLEFAGVALATSADNNLKLDKANGVATGLRIDDFLEVDEEALPSTPASGKGRITLGTDKKLKLTTSDGISKDVGGGGLAGRVATGNITAVVSDMIQGTSTGGFVVTLPTIPAGGGSIGVMDAGETCSATNYIRITPASGQSIDGYPANDSLDLDYVRANVILYAAPGATSWKVQYQTTSMVQGGQLPGQLNNSAIAAGFIGERISSAVSSVNGSVGSVNQITTISLTAGVWEISGVVCLQGTGTLTGNTIISTTINTSVAAGTLGDNKVDSVVTATSGGSAVVPSYRISTNSNITVYLLMQIFGGSGTGTFAGRITAVRAA